MQVSVNYRLGAFGWLAGRSFEEDGGHENAGYSDQRRALEWVQEYIERFKGDPGRVTIMGQSAGASSILHHLTANGGEGEPPFQQAILQSPAFFPQADRGKMEDVYQAFLTATGAADLTQLKGMDSQTLMDVNAAMTYRSPYGQFAFGPVVDGTYVRDLPGRSLMKGNFHENVKVMVGFNRDEGALFTPPWIRWRSQFTSYILDLFPRFLPNELTRAINELYPINIWIADPRYRIATVARAMSDVAVNCNAHYLNKAYNGTLYTYMFNKYPGVHGQDANYTVSLLHHLPVVKLPGSLFLHSAGWNLARRPDKTRLTRSQYWPVEAPPVNASVPLAQMMQRYFTQFIKHGNTSTGYDPVFDQYGVKRQIMRFGDWRNLFNNDASKMIDNPIRQAHCDFWQDAPYDPRPTPRARLTVQSGGSFEEM